MQKNFHEWFSIEKSILFIATFVGVVWVEQPSRFSFFGDSWDVLYLFLLDPRTILQPHNEHFIPLFKVFYFLQYKIFGAHHLGYMLVLYILHSVAVVLVYSVGKRISLSSWSSLAAALLFAFSSVAWEVTGWSFEQDFALGVVFIFASLDVFLRGAPRQRCLLWFAILSLIGYWAGGPIVLVLPLALIVYWVLLLIADRGGSVESLFAILSALLAPAAIYYLTVRLAVKLTSNLPLHPIAYPKLHLHLRDLPTMIDFSLFGTAWGLVLPTFTFIHSQAVLSASVLLILLTLVIVICYLGLSPRQRIFFWLLASITVGAYFVISLGRMQLGVATAVSSRYQYLSSASLSLLLALCWQGFRARMFTERTPLWWHALGVMLVAYFLAFHTKTTRVENLDAQRGKQVKEFLATVQRASLPEHLPPGAAVLGANFQVPPSLIPPRRPLWMILQVVQGNMQTVVPVEKYLADENELKQFNLLPNGSFEEETADDEWHSFADAKFHRDARAKHDGNYGVSINLPHHGSAFSKDIIHTCSPMAVGKVFTFAVQTQTHTPVALVARMVFKAADGAILATYASEPHPGDDRWHQLVTGGLSPSGTCTVGIDLANDGVSPVSAMADNALLLLHPGTVNRDGAVSFQLPSTIAQGR